MSYIVCLHESTMRAKLSFYMKRTHDQAFLSTMNVDSVKNRITEWKNKIEMVVGAVGGRLIKWTKMTRATKMQKTIEKIEQWTQMSAISVFFCFVLKLAFGSNCRSLRYHHQVSSRVLHFLFFIIYLLWGIVQMLLRIYYFPSTASKTKKRSIHRKLRFFQRKLTFSKKKKKFKFKAQKNKMKRNRFPTVNAESLRYQIMNN